jgi:hypothetical protein
MANQKSNNPVCQNRAYYVRNKSGINTPNRASKTGNKLGSQEEAAAPGEKRIKHKKSKSDARNLALSGNKAQLNQTLHLGSKF